MLNFLVRTIHRVGSYIARKRPVRELRGYPKSFPLKVEDYGRSVGPEVTISAGFRESNTRN